MKKLSVFLSVILTLFLFVGCGSPAGAEPPPSIVDPAENEEPENPTVEENRVQAIIDADFQKGFGIMGLNSASDGTSVKTSVKFGRGDPVWRVAQWGSRYNLNEPEEKILNNDTFILSDRSKSVTLDRTTNELTLALDATKEYDTKENSRTMWAHLLIEQEFDEFKSYRLDTFESLEATLDFNVSRANKGAIETNSAAETLPAQFLQYFYVVNYNAASSGFGSFLWLGLDYLDTRYEVTSLYYAQDHAGGNAGNYIYSLGADTLMGSDPFEIGKDYKIEVDILPYITSALEKASEYGFMMNTLLSDCVITGMNLGWEVPGAWDVSVTFCNLSLKATLKNQEEI